VITSCMEDSKIEWYNTMNINSYWDLKSLFMIAMLTARVMLNKLEHHRINVKSQHTVCGKKKHHVY
jgi:hypothetical protein